MLNGSVIKLFLFPLFFLTLESLYLFQIAFGCWMLFWSTHQLDICHQYLKIISHNSETKSQTFLKGWKEITFTGNMVTVTVFFAFSISEQMYFAILLTYHQTNQPTNRPTDSPTSWPTDQNTLTHWLIPCYVAWAADGYSSGPSSLLWNPKLQLHVHEGLPLNLLS